MKPSNVNGHACSKWSISECDGNGGWKLKNVRRKQVKAESLDGVKIMREIHTTNFDNKFEDRYWRVGGIYIIENDKLYSQFEEYKKELTEMGRPPDTIKETLAFSAETEKSCKDICQEGHKVGTKKRHILGHTGSGVHLVRHYDILTRYLMYQQTTSPTNIIVYKTLLGKTKPIVPRLHKDDHYVPPYVGFDSHVSARHIDKDMPICEALNCSYVYLYEFDQVASNPVKHPRQILPYVIIQLEKKVPCIPESPFLAVGTDETRSTWEVKGETRRGFRFMFTKSGLKGKHKVFSKGCNRASFESYLKGQILEMRTKSAFSLSKAKPPLLQKIDNSNININTGQLDTIKPPDLQKFSSNSQRSPLKKEKFRRELEKVVIPKSLRGTRQLVTLKPCVKLKRLDSAYLTGTRFRIKGGNENSCNVDSKKAKANFDVVSKEKTVENSVMSPSEVDRDKSKPSLQLSLTDKHLCKGSERSESGSILRFEKKSDFKTNRAHKESKPKETRTDHDSKLNSKAVVSESKESEGNRPTFTPSSMYKDKTESVTPKEHSDSKTDTTNGIKIQEGNSLVDINSVKDKINTKTVIDGTEIVRKKDNSKDVCSKAVLNSKTIPFCNKKSEKEISSISNSCMDGTERNSCTPVKNIAGEKTLLGKDSVTTHESRSGAELIQCKDTKTDKRKIETHQDSFNQTVNTQVSDRGTDISETCTSTKETEKKSLRSNEKLSATETQELRLKDAKAKTSQADENQTKMKYQTESQPAGCPQKEKQKKTFSSRCSPTKNKFGTFTCKINKGQDRLGKHATGRPRFKHFSENTEKSKTIIQAKSVFDFNALNQSSNEEQNALKVNLPTEMQDITEYNDKASKSYEHANELINISNLSADAIKDYENISVTQAVSSDKGTDAYEGHFHKHSNTAEKEHTCEKQIRNQTQHMVLEKSKSPVVANAAPDMLNISPVLVSAQTSTCSYSDTTSTDQNVTQDVRIPSEHVKQTTNYQGKDFANKNKHFYSVMSNFYDNTDNLKTFGLIKQFPEPFTQTHVVNPVLRAGLSAKTELPTPVETKLQQSKKDKSDKLKRKLETDTEGADPETTSGIVVTRKRINRTGTFSCEDENKVIVSKPSKTTTKTQKGKQNEFSNPRDQLSDVKTSPKQLIRQTIPHKEALVSVVTSSLNKEQRLSTPNGGVKVTGEKEAKPIRKTKESDKGKGSKCTGINENKNKTICKDNPVLPVSTSKAIISSSSSSTHCGSETSDLLHVSCDDKFTVAKSSKFIGDQIDSSRPQTLLANSEHVNESKVSGKKKGLNKPRKKADKTNKEKLDIHMHISSDAREISESKLIQYPNESTNTSKGPEKHQDLEIPEDVKNVTVDTLTADRLRSFLSTTAAVAMLRRKSTDQKNDELEGINSAKQNQGQLSAKPENSAKSKLSADENDTVSVNSMADLDFNRPKSNDEVNTKECFSASTADNDKTDDAHSEKISNTLQNCNIHSQRVCHKTNLKDNLKEPRLTFLKQNVRRDSAETHDSDSQDTVIGGVTSSPSRHINSASSSQENLKSFDKLLTKLKQAEVQSNRTCFIKQETEADGSQNESKMNGSNISSHCERRPPVRKDMLSLNSSQSDKDQNEIMLNSDIKQEPVDYTSDGSAQLTSSEGNQPVKAEPVSPSYFFPKTRRELAKGTAMLNATECRSAIIDTLKELSSVLKFLTEGSSQKEKQMENVALVAKKMCNVLSCEKKSKASISEGLQNTELATKDNVIHDLHIKSEPIDTDYSKSIGNSSQSNLNRSYFMPTDNFSHSEKERENYCEAECSSADQEYQYEYILKSSEDEYQQTCDENDDSSVKVHEVSHQKEPVQTNFISSKGYASQNETAQNQYLETSSETSVVLPTQHEIDELPQLFDPNEEPDISCLEQFGIPNELHRKITVLTENTSLPSLEIPVVDNANSTTQPVTDFVKEIKIEKDLGSSPAKLKPKQNFSLKSGVLNKGLKDRKNMFDLKTNASRRKTLNKNPIDKEFAVVPKSSFALKPSANYASESIDSNASVKEESHEKSTVIMNEVYRTVCEKLSTLRESSCFESTGNIPSGNTNPVAESVTRKSKSESLSNQGNLCPSKNIKPQESSGNKSEEKEKPPISGHKEVIKKTNIKKHAVIPFHTVIRLKKQQFWKYRMGETNKKFIDYRELFAKMSGRQAKSLSSDIHEKQKRSDEQEVSTGISDTNEKLGKKLNYFIPSCKTSKISERGTALIEDNKTNDSHLESVNLKRSNFDSDERKNSKRFKLSTDETEKRGAESRRSRSRSSHRSSASGHNSAGHSSLSEKQTAFNDRGGLGNSSVRPVRRLNVTYNRNKNSFPVARTHFNRRGTYRAYPTRFNLSSNKNQRFTGKSSFRKNGTGYFSWRRKYQPHKNVFDGFVVTGKGAVQTMSEYAEWNRFKERETIRDQIENAIKEYRRTFEDTPDYKKGDEKVASYLTFLTEKLDKIQSKRNKLSTVEINEERRRRQRSTSSENVPPRSSQRKTENKSPLFRKLEKSHNFHQHETQQHSSVKRFSSSLASDSDSFSYKQRRHTSCIEEYLKEHIAKHCQHLTKQIKQEMEDLKTTKQSSLEKEDKERSYPKDFDRNKYDFKNKFGEDTCDRHSRERYDSNQTRTGNSSRHGGEYDQAYHGSSGKSYYRYNRHHDKYDKGKHIYDRERGGNKHDNRYSYRDEGGRRQDSFDSFRKQHNSSYRKRYDNSYGADRKSYREYDPGNFGDSKFVHKKSRNNVDRSHTKSEDYRKTYDYQQNFDKYQAKFPEHYKSRNEHKGYEGDTWKSCNLKNTYQQPSKTFQPMHWFRGKYNRYFSKSGTDSRDEADEELENDKEENDAQPVQAEFDATQYRQFIPVHNKRGRGGYRGTNKYQTVHKQHYQTGKFSKFRNPPTFFIYEDDQVNTGDNNGKETSSLEGPQKGGTSIQIALGESDKKSIQGLTSVKSDRAKSIPASCSSVQQTPQKEHM